MDTPSGRIIAAAAATRDIKTSTGRTLTVRDLSLLDQARIMKAIGPAQSNNIPYNRIACMACQVTAVDGVPYPMPRDAAGVEAASGRLDDDGFAALNIELEQRTRALMQAAADAAAAGEAPAPGNA